MESSALEYFSFVPGSFVPGSCALESFALGSCALESFALGSFVAPCSFAPGSFASGSFAPGSFASRSFALEPLFWAAFDVAFTSFRSTPSSFLATLLWVIVPFDFLRRMDNRDFTRDLALTCNSSVLFWNSPRLARWLATLSKTCLVCTAAATLSRNLSRLKAFTFDVWFEPLGCFLTWEANVFLTRSVAETVSPETVSVWCISLPLITKYQNSKKTAHIADTNTPMSMHIKNKPTCLLNSPRSLVTSSVWSCNPATNFIVVAINASWQTWNTIRLRCGWKVVSIMMDTKQTVMATGNWMRGSGKTTNIPHNINFRTNSSMSHHSAPSVYRLYNQPICDLTLVVYNTLRR